MLDIFGRRWPNLLIVTDFTLILSPLMDRSLSNRPLFELITVARGFHVATLIHNSVTSPKNKEYHFYYAFLCFVKRDFTDRAASLMKDLNFVKTKI